VLMFIVHRNKLSVSKCMSHEVGLRAKALRYQETDEHRHALNHECGHVAGCTAEHRQLSLASSTIHANMMLPNRQCWSLSQSFNLEKCKLLWLPKFVVQVFMSLLRPRFS
jgi:hypothetical protein